MLTTLIWFLITLGILVTFHEFGHFYIARRCGVKVLRFSVGFGKTLYTWRDKLNTEFVIAAIPLGGYVKMLDEREGEVAEEDLPQAFSQKPVWQRMAIVVAGPVANFLLAIVLYFVLALAGSKGLVPVIGSVNVDSLAATAGIEVNHEILSINGKPTKTWTQVHQQLAGSIGDTGELRLELKPFTDMGSDSELAIVKAIPIEQWLGDQEQPDLLSELGIGPLKPLSFEIVELVQGQPADLSGLMPGDLLLSVDEKPIESLTMWTRIIQSKPEVPVNVDILRNNQKMSLVITPIAYKQAWKWWQEPTGRIGAISRTNWPEGMLRDVNYSLIDSISYGFTKTWDQAVMILSFLKKLILLDISFKNMGGAFTIAQVAGETAALGWTYYLSFLAFFSVSLGVFNLLPIPVLDGGHLLFYSYEALRGKPLSEKIQMLGYQVGLFVIVSIMLIAHFNDLVRIFS